MIDLSSILPIKRFLVKGHSMEPLVRNGGNLLINCWAYLFTTPKRGDIIAFQPEKQRGNILLKKIDKCLDKGKYFVVGINKNDSADSRQFGVVEKGEILGKLLTFY